LPWAGENVNGPPRMKPFGKQSSKSPRRSATKSSPVRAANKPCGHDKRSSRRRLVGRFLPPKQATDSRHPEAGSRLSRAWIGYRGTRLRVAGGGSRSFSCLAVELSRKVNRIARLAEKPPIADTLIGVPEEACLAAESDRSRGFRLERHSTRLCLPRGSRARPPADLTSLGRQFKLMEVPVGLPTGVAPA